MNILKKVTILFDNEYKKKLIKLSILIIVGMFFEIIGLGLILPTIYLISNPDSLYKIDILNNILHKLGKPSSNTIIVYGMILLAFFYFIKTIYLTFLNWEQSKFSSNFTAHTSKKLYEGYLNMPYSDHLEKNSSILVRNIQNEVSIFTNLAQIIIFLASEFSIIIGIFILLISLEPIGAITTSLFLSSIIIIFYKISKKKVTIWGTQRQIYSGEIQQNLMQGLGGIKDIKLIGKEEYFLNEYHDLNKKISKITSKINTIEQMPRLVLELIAVTGLTCLIVIMVLLNKPVNEIIPVLGIFVGAAFRMIPSINKIMYASQKLLFSMPVIELLYNEFSYFKNINKQYNNNQKIDFNEEINLSSLTFKYNTSGNYVFNNISLKIKKGECIGIIGESGTGKSTLIDILLGLLTPISGHLSVDNKKINEKNIRSWQDIVGYVPQSIYLTDDTFRNNIALGLNYKEINENKINEVIKYAQLEDLIKSLPSGLDTKVGERGVRISGGQRQRIGIARALYRNTEILVFDEATSALDTNTEIEVMNAINNLKGYKTLIIVAHRFSTLSKCDKIFKLDKFGIHETIL
jgi:ABC-type multidrug transport system fused ATPase/permease subunit